MGIGLLEAREVFGIIGLGTFQGVLGSRALSSIRISRIRALLDSAIFQELSYKLANLINVFLASVPRDVMAFIEARQILGRLRELSYTSIDGIFGVIPRECLLFPTLCLMSAAPPLLRLGSGPAQP